MLGAVHAGRTPRLTGPYTERDPFHDPFVMFAYLAGNDGTDRVRHRGADPAAAADGAGGPAGSRRRSALRRPAASGGRGGLKPGEYQALGQDFRSRGARQEEQIELLRRLFTDPVVDFAGRFDRVDRTALVPKPAHPVPIWLGGSSDKAFERAARLGDGFIFFGGTDHAVNAWDRVRELVREHGRPADGFGGEYVLLPWGEIDQLSADIDAWQRAGGTHASIVTMGRGLDSVDGHIHLISTLADALDRP